MNSSVPTALNSVSFLFEMTITGIAIALVGTIVIALGSAAPANGDSNPLLGDFFALPGSWAVSLYLLLGREAQRRGLGISGYSAIAYTTAAIALLALPLALNANYAGYSQAVYVCILLTAIVPQLVGHTIFN